MLRAAELRSGSQNRLDVRSSCFGESELRVGGWENDVSLQVDGDEPERLLAPGTCSVVVANQVVAVGEIAGGVAQ